MWLQRSHGHMGTMWLQARAVPHALLQDRLEQGTQPVRQGGPLLPTPHDPGVSAWARHGSMILVWEHA